jgi:hypothetical protein
MRAGNDSMMARRRAGSSRDHAEISSIVRPQPSQSRERAFMRQTSTQGESGFFISSASLHRLHCAGRGGFM